MAIALEMPGVLGSLGIRHSNLNWVVGPGRQCKRGDLVAHAYVMPGAKFPATEAQDCQVGLRAPLDGYVAPLPTEDGGGWSLIHPLTPWERKVVGMLVPDASTSETTLTLEPLFIASRRRFQQVDVKGPLGASWPDSTRAWWGMDRLLGATPTTLLSIGICEQRTLVRGDQLDFVELAELLTGPTHVTFVPDDVLVPTSRTLLSWIRRTDAERTAIREDFGQQIAALDYADPEAPATLACLTTLLAQLMRPSPFAESPTVITPMGIIPVGPPQYALLSFVSEASPTFVHKRLRYTISLHNFRYVSGGPQFRKWLTSNFDLVPSSRQIMRASYEELVRELDKTHLMVLNETCSSPADCPPSYAGLDKPFTRLGSARYRNAVLADMARELPLSLIDVDAMAVELGTTSAGLLQLHPNRALADMVRAELARIMRNRN